MATSEITERLLAMSRNHFASARANYLTEVIMKFIGFSILSYTTMLLLMSNLFIGCDDPMMDTVMDSVLEPSTDVVAMPEDDSFQEELPTIEFSVDIAENTLPEGFVQLRSDQVYYSDDFDDNSIVVDTAKEAIENEKTVKFFNESAEWLEEICGKTEYSGPRFELIFYFTDRQERERFTSAVPNYDLWNAPQSISVVNGTAYYYQYIRPSRRLCEAE